MTEIAKRVILLSGEESDRAALRRAVEEAGAVAASDGNEATGDGQILAVLYEITQGVSTDELRRTVAHATSTWAGVPVIAYHPYSYAERDPATRNGHRTNAMLLKYLGFRAVIEEPQQLSAALRELQQPPQSRAAAAAGDERTIITGGIAAAALAGAAPHESELGEALLGLAQFPRPVAPKHLRTAFEVVTALHFASDRKQAAQITLAGLRRMIHAERWTIYVSRETKNGADELEPLVVLGQAGAPRGEGGLAKNQAARDAAQTVEVVKRKENSRHTVAVPLIYAERVYGVLQAERDAANSFRKAEVDLLAALAVPVACALANAERTARAEQLSLTDDLTKLHNARYLRQFLTSEIKRARRYNSPVAVIFIDLDNFKRVNDVHGHLTGSHVLKELAAVVLRSVRDTDMVARYGGDEFVVVLPQSRAEQAVFVAERMRERIAQGTFTGGRRLQLRVTASLGVGAFPQTALSPQQLLDSADGAMYQAKADQKNCVRLAPEISAEKFDENVFSS